MLHPATKADAAERAATDTPLNMRAKGVLKTKQKKRLFHFTETLTSRGTDSGVMIDAERRAFCFWSKKKNKTIKLNQIK